MKSIEIHGQHSSLYMAELPPWLSSEVIQHLLQQFQHYAKAEVDRMLQVMSARSRHQWHPLSSKNDAPVCYSFLESSGSEDKDKDDDEPLADIFATVGSMEGYDDNTWTSSVI